MISSALEFVLENTASSFALHIEVTRSVSVLRTRTDLTPEGFCSALHPYTQCPPNTIPRAIAPPLKHFQILNTAAAAAVHTGIAKETGLSLHEF